MDYNNSIDFQRELEGLQERVAKRLKAGPMSGWTDSQRDEVRKDAQRVRRMMEYLIQQSEKKDGGKG